MKPLLISLNCLVTLLVLSAGCSTPKVNTVEPAQTESPRAVISDKRVLYDKSLSGEVQVLGVNQGPPESEFLKVQLEVMNTTSHLHSFTYRFEWFDANGMLITSPPSQAIPRQIEAKETIFISATAPTPTAKDFRVKFLKSVQ